MSSVAKKRRVIESCNADLRLAKGRDEMITRFRMWSSLGALLASTSGAALAQSAPDDATLPQATSESALGEIIVTARRREENLQEVPVAVSAFSSETLLRAGVTKAEDLVRVTPSLQFSRFV